MSNWFYGMLGCLSAVDLEIIFQQMADNVVMAMAFWVSKYETNWIEGVSLGNLGTVFINVEHERKKTLSVRHCVVEVPSHEIQAVNSEMWWSVHSSIIREFFTYVALVPRVILRTQKFPVPFLLDPTLR